MNIKKHKNVEWMCSHCGKKVTKRDDTGRPMPGTCPRRTPNKPHMWVKNREW